MSYRNRDHSKRALQKRIVSIGRRGAKLDRDIHETEIDCLAHASEHGDISLLTELYHAMPNGSRRKAMAQHAKDHAPVKTTGKDSELAFRMRKGWQADQFKLDEAEATPFWEYTKEPEPKPFDLDRFFESIRSRLRKAKDKGELDATRSVLDKKFREVVNEIV